MAGDNENNIIIYYFPSRKHTRTHELRENRTFYNIFQRGPTDEIPKNPKIVYTYIIIIIITHRVHSV